MKIGYILSEMTFLRYYIPIVREAMKRGISSTFFVSSIPSVKYNCPLKYESYLKKCSEEFGFDLCYFNGVISEKCDYFLVLEGCGIQFLPQKTKIISLTYMRDFVESYEKYISTVDNVVFINKFMASNYYKLSDKNLYIGCTKYDVDLEKRELLSRYSFRPQKNALVMFPETQHLRVLDMKGIYGILRDNGFNIIVKSRAKHRVPNDLKGDYYFEDFKWFPHVSMELEVMSDLAIVFDSTATKEFVMLDLPFINFEVAKYDAFDFLQRNSFCRNLTSSFEKDQLQNAINELLSSSNKDVFKKVRKDLLFDDKLCSVRLLDYMEKNK